jgi:hypothetical protein
MGIHQPPWKYAPSELAMDLSYHLVYGAGVGTGEAVLDRQGVYAARLSPAPVPPASITGCNWRWAISAGVAASRKLNTR